MFSITFCNWSLHQLSQLDLCDASTWNDASILREASTRLLLFSAVKAAFTACWLRFVWLPTSGRQPNTSLLLLPAFRTSLQGALKTNRRRLTTGKHPRHHTSSSYSYPFPYTPSVLHDTLNVLLCSSGVPDWIRLLQWYVLAMSFDYPLLRIFAVNS